MCRIASQLAGGLGFAVMGLALLSLFAAEHARAQQPAADNPFADNASAEIQADGNPFGGAAERPAEPRAKVRQLPAAAPSDVDSLNAKIRQTLLMPTIMEFVEMPLQDAMSYLKDYHGIQIQLDTKALEEAGVGSDTPVTRTLNGVPLFMALRLMLDELDLTYAVRGGMLLVTTKEKAASNFELRVYDVEESVGHGLTTEAVNEMLKSLSGSSQSECKLDGRLQIVPFHNLLIVRASQQDQEELVSLLTKIKAKLHAD